MQILRDVGRGLARGALPLAGYEVLVKVLAAGIVGPLAAWVLAMLISFTGSVTVSNEQILSFALSPLGLLTLLVAGTLGFLITFLEQAGLMSIASTAYAGSPCSAVAALWRTVRSGRDLLALALVQIGLYFACFVPFAVLAGWAYVGWLSDHDINYYLAEKPPAFWRAVAVGATALLGLLLVWGWLYVRLMFALPACVLADQRPVEGLRASLRLTRGSVLRMAAILMIWLLIVTAVGAVLGGVLQVVEHVAIWAAGERLAVLIPVLAGLVILNVLTATVISFVSVTTNALLIVRLYREATQESPELQPESPLAQPGARGLPGWLSKKRLIAAAAVVVLAATGAVTYVLVQQIDIEDKVAVTAHRGASRSAPENSLSAVEAAIRQGADFAEIDVQETADGVIVVFHDSDLKRITGLDRNIWEVEYEELESLDAGGWFSPEFRGEPIPTLQQVIDTARGRIQLNIELKFNGHDKKLVERVVAILRENDFQAECVLSSLESDGLLRAKRLDGRLRIGKIISVSIGDATRLDVDFLSAHRDNATPEFIRSLHRAGKEIHVWTVNDRQAMSSLVDLGVDNIITDEPETARAVLTERAELSTAERLLLGVRHRLAR